MFSQHFISSASVLSLVQCARQPEICRTFTKWHTSRLPSSTYSYRNGNTHSSCMIIQPVGCTISTGYRRLRVGIIDYFCYWRVWESEHVRRKLKELSDPKLSAHRDAVTFEIGHKLYCALYFSPWNLLTPFLGLTFQFYWSSRLLPAVTLLAKLLSFVFFSVQ
jgi:hypothetical protein